MKENEISAIEFLIELAEAVKDEDCLSFQITTIQKKKGIKEHTFIADGTLPSMILLLGPVELHSTKLKNWIIISQQKIEEEMMRTAKEREMEAKVDEMVGIEKGNPFAKGEEE